MNFVIAAGGTGGHLFPGIAVGEVLLRRGHSVMLLISEKEIDALATQSRTEFRIEKLPGIGMPKLLSFGIFTFAARFGKGLLRCRSLFKQFKPDGILGMGGFTSTAPILAGRLGGVPTFLHESNAIPGKANRLNAKLASTILLGFQECEKYFPKAKCQVTGTPIRQTLAERLSKAEARAAFGLDPNKTTLLVMGGSQGAGGINRSITAALPKLSGTGLQAVHLSGAADEASVRAAYEAAGIPAFVAPFWHKMEQAYSAADLAVSRSGAASLMELSHFALPSFLIPYPFAADDHQTFNARIFERAGAALLLPEKELSGDSLADKIRWSLDEGGRLSEMSACSARLAPHDAAERVAQTILDHVKPRPRPRSAP